MKVDPLTVKCPKCKQPKWQRCIRLSGPYGMGQPLRKMHQDRFILAREEAKAAIQRVVNPNS